MAEWWVVPSITVAVMAAAALIFKIGRRVGSVDSDRDKLRAFMEEVRNDIKEILGRLPPAPVAGGGPIQLTDLGRDISKALQAREWAEGEAAALGERVKGKPPYEVQAICYDYGKKEFHPTDEQEAKIRMCAYENALDRDKVLDVLAIELRDVLLKGA